MVSFRSLNFQGDHRRSLNLAGSVILVTKLLGDHCSSLNFRPTPTRFSRSGFEYARSWEKTITERRKKKTDTLSPPPRSCHPPSPLGTGRERQSPPGDRILNHCEYRIAVRRPSQSFEGIPSSLSPGDAAIRRKQSTPPPIGPSARCRTHVQAPRLRRRPARH
jgi:hypothetical protein